MLLVAVHLAVVYHCAISGVPIKLSMFELCYEAGELMAHNGVSRQDLELHGRTCAMVILSQPLKDEESFKATFRAWAKSPEVIKIDELRWLIVVGDVWTNYSAVTGTVRAALEAARLHS